MRSRTRSTCDVGKKTAAGSVYTLTPPRSLPIGVARPAAALNGRIKLRSSCNCLPSWSPQLTSEVTEHHRLLSFPCPRPPSVRCNVAQNSFLPHCLPVQQHLATHRIVYNATPGKNYAADSRDQISATPIPFSHLGCQTDPPTQEPGSYFNDAALTELTREQPGDELDDVIFGSTHGVRTIELNRPKKLNSLNGSMARKIIPRLREWEKSQLANVVVIKGEGRAFCAGGDVAALAKQNKTPEGQNQSRQYFGLEYKLDHMIATCTKPYVAFLDGITMGGGVGLSIHAPFRIATENTVFAMPETTIGFFPDVGASFFLPKMDGQMGMYLALTSEQLKGVDVLYVFPPLFVLPFLVRASNKRRIASLPNCLQLSWRCNTLYPLHKSTKSTGPSRRAAVPRHHEA